jgi:hypothetical protein
LFVSRAGLGGAGAEGLPEGSAGKYRENSVADHSPTQRTGRQVERDRPGLPVRRAALHFGEILKSRQQLAEISATERWNILPATRGYSMAEVGLARLST